MSSLLPSNPTKGSESCNHVAQFNVCCCTGTYCINIRSWCLLMHTKGGCRKMQHCHAWTSYNSNFNIQRNITIYHKVYSKISKVNYIYQIIWLIWILKLSGGNSNNKWKHIDHSATFNCLLQLSSHKVKHGPKEHHLAISNSQHKNNHTHETINKYNDPTLPPDDRQTQSTPTNSNITVTSHFYKFNSTIAMKANKCSTNI
jgi:hypothetical protein